MTFPPPRATWPREIINAAGQIPQKQSVFRWIFGVFWSPVPAFCLALFLAIGFLAGVMNYGGAGSHAIPESVIEQLLSEEEGLL